jgi:transcriptional regulator with XRE-family HTH domain
LKTSCKSGKLQENHPDNSIRAMHHHNIQSAGTAAAIREAVGERLVNLRQAAGVSRDKLADYCKISSPTLRSWEIGARTLQPGTADLLASAFQNYGLLCTSDWILKGNGLNPLTKEAQNSEEAYIAKEKYRFESFYENSKIIRVADNHMSPFVKMGDFVGGICVKPADTPNFVGEVCITETSQHGIAVRLVQKNETDGLYNLLSFSGKDNILGVGLIEVAVVIFMRRRSGLIPSGYTPALL